MTSRKRQFKSPQPAPQQLEIFVAAAKTGDETGLRQFVDTFGTRHIDRKNAHGDTALTVAARFNQVAAARLLLEAGADVDARDGHRGTALMAASVGGHIDIIRDLLGHGADVTKKSYAHVTAEWYARANHHDEAAQLIAETPLRRAEAAAQASAETQASLTQGTQKPLTVGKPLIFSKR